MYYKKWSALERIVAIVIISSAICLVLGGSLGFLFGAICTMASDKKHQARAEVKSSVGRRSIVEFSGFSQYGIPVESRAEAHPLPSEAARSIEVGQPRWR